MPFSGFGQWPPLLPRLGAFVGHENRIPYDYDEVLALTAPRPVILVQPTLDYQSTVADLRTCVAEAGKIFALHGKPSALRLVEIDDYNHYFGKIAEEVIRQLQTLSLLEPVQPTHNQLPH